MRLQYFEGKIESIISRSTIEIGIIVVVGLLMRIYFVPWSLPSEAADTYAYMMYAYSFASGYGIINVNYLV